MCNVGKEELCLSVWHKKLDYWFYLWITGLCLQYTKNKTTYRCENHKQHALTKKCSSENWSTVLTSYIFCYICDICIIIKYDSDVLTCLDPSDGDSISWTAWVFHPNMPVTNSNNSLTTCCFEVIFALHLTVHT
jgi:hypothetical protein